MKELPYAGTVFLTRGVETSTLEATSFKGEYDHQSFLYLIILWVVSIWAMFTNMYQAIRLKMGTKAGQPIKKILWDMGRNPEHVSSFAVDRYSSFNHQSKHGGAGWLSLILFYNYWEEVNAKLKNNLEGKLTRWWIGRMHNRQAVTNRKKIVVDLLSGAFARFSNEQEIRLLSIASGSAQAVLDAILLHPELNIKVKLLDLDKTALAEAAKKIKEYGLEDRFEIILGTPKKIEKICETFKPQIVEMVGFLDYLTQEDGAALIGRAKELLPEGGLFLTCNIKLNLEKIFLDWVLLWPMIYRSEEQLADVLIRAGFAPDNIKLYYEPFKIHGIAICEK